MRIAFGTDEHMPLTAAIVDALKELGHDVVVNEEVEAMGVKVLEQYALLGGYDFLNIIEAPDEKSIARVAMTLSARGTLKTTTLTAIPVDEFIAGMQGT